MLLVCCATYALVILIQGSLTFYIMELYLTFLGKVITRQMIRLTFNTLMGHLLYHKVTVAIVEVCGLD